MQNSENDKNDRVVLCAASGYNQQYYLNPDMNVLPSQVKKELKAGVVIAAEKSKAIIIVGFNENGEIYIEASKSEDDFNYDEIGAVLAIDGLLREKEKLFESIKIWYQFSNNKKIDLKNVKGEL